MEGEEGIVPRLLTPHQSSPLASSSGDPGTSHHSSSLTAHSLSSVSDEGVSERDCRTTVEEDVKKPPSPCQDDAAPPTSNDAHDANETFFSCVSAADEKIGKDNSVVGRETVKECLDSLSSVTERSCSNDMATANLFSVFDAETDKLKQTSDSGSASLDGMAADVQMNDAEMPVDESIEGAASDTPLRSVIEKNEPSGNFMAPQGSPEEKSPQIIPPDVTMDSQPSASDSSEFCTPTTGSSSPFQSVIEKNEHGGNFMAPQGSPEEQLISPQNIPPDVTMDSQPSASDSSEFCTPTTRSSSPSQIGAIEKESSCNIISSQESHKEDFDSPMCDLPEKTAASQSSESSGATGFYTPEEPPAPLSVSPSKSDGSQKVTYDCYFEFFFFLFSFLFYTCYSLGSSYLVGKVLSIGI